MKTISRYIMTLALLLTAVTGAWADGIVCTASDLGKVLCTDGSIYENVSAASTAGKEAVAMIAYVDETNKNGLALALTDIPYFYTWDNTGSYNEHKTAPEICSALNTSKAVTGGTWKLPSQDEWKQMFSANGGNEGSYTGLNTAIGNAGGTALLENEYWSSSEFYGDAWLVNLADGNASWNPDGKHYGRMVRACLAFDIAAPTIDVTPVEGKTNEWTFSMPGSDVEIAPIYAPVAQWAEVETVKQLPAALEGVIADTDAPLIVEGTVAFAGTSTEVKQGTVMYAVTPATVTEAPALDAANKWSADVPTAKLVADGGVDVLVWYYIKGADTPDGVAATLDNTFDDTEPACLTVTVLSNKFDIALNAANANTIEAGKATVTVGGTAATVTEGKLEGVKMGSEVKVKANTGYKFRKVEVKKKEAAATWDGPIASAATAADIGKVVCAAGHLHDAKTAVLDGCTAVGILGKVTETGHGLILALQNAAQQEWFTINGWESVTTYAGTTLKLLPANALGSNLTSYTTLGGTAVSNWAVAQQSDYDAIFTNLGSTTSDEYGTTYDGNVNAYITTGVGGSAISGHNWSATEDSEDANYACDFESEFWNGIVKTASLSVRPVLGF